MFDISLHSSTISNMGLLVDIVGAFFLSKAIILRFGPQIMKETDDLYDGNPLRLKGAAEQFVEGWAGFIFLFFGFILQYVANLNSTSATDDRSWSTELICTLVVFVAANKVVNALSMKRSRRLVCLRWAASIKRDLKEAKEPYLVLFEEALSLKADKKLPTSGRKKRLEAIIEKYGGANTVA